MTSKNMYEEALADAKSLKEVAETNAKHAVINAVLPRIREMIETSLLEADDQEDQAHDKDDDKILTDDIADEDKDVSAAISPPDEEGKVTLDIDAMTDEGALGVGEYETSLEGKRALDNVVESRKPVEYSDAAIKELCERTDTLAGAGRLVRATSGYSDQILRTISHVQDMYGCLQEAKDIAPDKKKEHEDVLEGCNRKLQELKMTKKNKQTVNESDVTLKLTGLPDDVDLDSVGVDLISDEEGEASEETPLDADGDHDGDELDLDDLGGDEGGEQDMGESLSHLSDDTVVEIDENMLRKEIARMKSLREDAKVGAGAGTMSAAELDDFGGGKDEGEPFLDGEVETDGAEPLGEGEEQDDMDESDDQDQDQDDMDESEEMDQLGNRRAKDEFDDGVADGHDSPMADRRRHESLRRRFGFEKRLQERLRTRIRATRKAALKAEGKKAAQLIRSHRALMARLSESVKRADKIKGLVESTKPRAAAPNGGRKSADATLRAKLAEANLFNAKLSYTNKILQNDQLTQRQKARMIEQFDAAKSIAETKLVYESLTKLLARKPVTESADRKVIGSASRASKPAGSKQVVSEGFEVERWGKLAGIK